MSCKPTYKGIQYDSLEELYRSNNIGTSVNSNPEQVNRFKQKSYWKYYSTQQETSKKDKTEQTQGVQFTTLIQANILEGEAVLTDKNGNEQQAQDVIDDINELYVERVNLTRDELYKRLKVKSTAKGATVDALLKEILNNLNSKEVSEVSKEEVEELLKNAKGLDTVLSSMAYESVLNSIVNKLIIKPKRFGSPLTQSPNLGFTQMEFNQDKKTIAKQEGLIRLDDGSLLPELPFYQEGQDYLGVYLPNHFKHLGDISDLDSRLLDLIGFRIPSQAENSIERIRIMGFLPESYGNMIVVPAQLTTKTGSDFDIDKLNIYFPTFYKDSKGNIKYHELLTDSNSTLKERYNKFVRRNVKGVKSIIKDLKQSSEYLKYLEEVEKSYERILKNSKITFKQLVDSLEDAEIGNNIAFTSLPVNIKDVYKEYNRLLNNTGIEGLDKQQAFSEFTDEVILNMNPEGKVLDNLNLLKATYDIQLTLLGGELIAAKNEYTDNLGTFQIDKSNLTDKINEDVINAIADFYNIETRQKFSTRTILNQNSIQAIDNAIHEKYLTILDSKEYKKNMLKSNTDENIKTLALEMKNANTDDSSDTEINFLTLGYHIKSRQGAQLGKMVLGQGALHTKHHIVTQVADVFLNERPPRLENIQKVQKDLNKTVLKTFTNSAGESISDTFSELINAFVDVLKEPYIKYSNITVHNAGTFFYMLRSGATLEQVVYFFNHPAIRYYNKKIAQLQFDTKNYNTRNHKIIIDELLLKIDKDARSIQTLDTKFLKARAITKNKEINSTSIDYSVIMEFDRMFKASSRLNEYMRVTKFDSSGIGTSFGETEALLNDIDKFERDNSKDNKDYIENWYNIFEKDGKLTMLGAYKNILEESPNYFTNLYTADRYEGLIEARKNTVSLVKSKNAGVIRNKYNSDFATYIVQNFGNLPKSLIYPSKESSTVGQRILGITKNKTHKLTNSIFLNALNVNLVETPHKLLLFNSAAVTTLTADTLSKSFSELMYFDAELGYDIIKVAILQDGFSNSPYSFLKNVAVEHKNAVTEVFHSVFNPNVIKDFDTKFRILNYKKVLERQRYNTNNVEENKYVIGKKDATTGGFPIYINIDGNVYTINSDKTIGDNENTSIATGRSALNYTDSIIGKANKVININQSQTYLDNASRLEIVKSC